MAEFGTKLTDLGTTNFTGYAKQGVVDKSKAMETESKFSLGTQAVEYGIDKLKEYDKYQTLKGVAEEIGGIMQEQEDRSYLGQAALAEDQEALKVEMGFAQDQVGYDGSYPSVLNQELTDNTRGVTNALAEKTDRLNKARAQGAMTEFELETRLAQLTQEAIARNPALAPEIMKHVSQVANMNNLTAKVKQDAAVLQSQQEAQDEYNKSILKMAESDTIDLNLADPKYFDPATGGYNYKEIRKAIEEKQGLVEANTAIEQLVKNKDLRFKLNGKAFIEKGLHVEANRARLAKFQTDVNLILKSNMPQADKLAAIETAKVNNRAELEQAYGLSGISITDPDIKAGLDSLDNQMAALSKQITEKVGNAGQLKIVQDANKLIIETKKGKALEEMPGLSAELALFDLYGENARLASLDTLGSNLSMFHDFIASDRAQMASEKKARKNSKLFEIDPNTNKSIAYQGMEVTRNRALTEDDSFSLLEQEIDNTLGFVMSGSRQNKTAAARDLMKLFHDPRTTEDLVMKMNPTMKAELENVALDYKNVLKSRELDTFIAVNPNAKFELDRNGELKFASGTYKDDYRNFTRQGLRSINETFGAFHKLSGNNSLDKSIELFYSDLGIPGISEKK